MTRKETSALEVKAVASQCCWPHSVPTPWGVPPAREPKAQLQVPQVMLQGVRGSPPGAGSYCW